MTDYPVAPVETLLGIVSSVHDSIQKLNALKQNIEGYMATIEMYQGKIAEAQTEVEIVMADLSNASDQYVTAYLGYNPKTETPPVVEPPVEETPAE